MPMFEPALASPDGMPVLSRGRHRNSRRGACFMEYASFLAGERWSDHPACTHPAIAALARLVNDWTSDEARPRLTMLIPSVVGLTGDRRTELVVAILAASAALPVASESRQRALAAGLIECGRRLSDVDPELGDRLSLVARRALDQAPLAERWALRQPVPTPRRRGRSWPMCEAIVMISVSGLGEACIDDPDARLRTLLDVTIRECSLMTPEPTVDGPAGVVDESTAPERAVRTLHHA